jgi:uncharacterized protein (DUF433 family)
MTSKLVTRISVDPDICFGKPHIRGTRIKVSFVLELLASDWSIDEILKEYEHLNKEDIIASLEYASNNLE